MSNTISRIEVAVGGTNSPLVMEVMSVTGGLPDTVLATATNPTDVAAGVKAFADSYNDLLEDVAGKASALLETVRG